MNWILIILLTTGYKGGLTTEKFDSKASCEHTGKEITTFVKGNVGWTATLKYKCINTGVE